MLPAGDKHMHSRPCFGSPNDDELFEMRAIRDDATEGWAISFPAGAPRLP